MATVNNAMMVTFETGTNLSNAFGELVKLNAAGRVVKTAAISDVAIGVVAQNIKETGNGIEIPVAMLNGSGVLKCKVSGAVTRGHYINPEGTSGDHGKAESAGATPTANDFVVGRALEAAAADGDIIEFVPMGFRWA